MTLKLVSTTEEQAAFIARKERFIDAYAASFLAAEASRKIDKTNSSGNHKLFERQPVEDAFFLGQMAWAQAVGLNALQPMVGVTRPGYELPHGVG